MRIVMSSPRTESINVSTNTPAAPFSVTSLFAAYLSTPEAQAQLAKNEATMRAGNSPISFGDIGRIFNSFPLHENITVLIEALKKNKLIEKIDPSEKNNPDFIAWLDLMMAMLLNDLFDLHGAIKKDVYAALNSKAQVLDNFKSANGFELLKKSLQVAYVSLLSEFLFPKLFLNQITNELTAEIIALLQHCIKEKTTSLTPINKENIEAINERLIQADENPQLSEELKQIIQQFTFKKACSDLETATNGDSFYSQALRDLGGAALTQAKAAAAEKMPLPVLTRALCAVRHVIEEPEDENSITLCRVQLREIEKIKCPPKPQGDNETALSRDTNEIAKHERFKRRKKLLKAAIFGVAAAAVLTASVALAIVSFGAAAPISICGLVLGASLLTGIGATSVGVGVGVPLALGAGFTFFQALKRKRSDLKEDEEVVDKAHPRKRVKRA